jgi:hypothetical protein
MSDEEKLFVSYDDKITGPFEKGQINAFIVSGLYPSSLRISENNSGPWRDYKYDSSTDRLLENENLFKSTIKQSKPANGSHSVSPPAKNKGFIAWLKDTAGGLVVIFIIYLVALGAVKSCNTGNQSSSGSNYRSRSSSSTSYVGNYSSSSRENTPTYRISHSDHLRLQQMSAKIEADRASLNSEKSRIESIDSEIDRERSMLERSSSYAVDNFNEKVQNRNLLNNQYKQNMRAFNYEVDTYNNELRRVGTLRN